MTEIDVPDWVVEAAMRAEDKFYAEKNYGSFSDIQGDDAAEAMRVAITAALGAWVVPVGRKQPHKEYLMHARALEDYAAGLFGEAGINIAAKFTEQLYTLRQEKPE
jgi:hypothetical protein